MITSTKLRISRKSASCILPPPKISTWEWIKKHGVTKRGDPFNYLDFPWVEGLADAWDSLQYECIWMRAGSRLGKTETAMQFLLCAQANDPDVAMLGGPTQEKVKNWVVDRMYPIFEQCNPTRSWVPPKNKRGTTSIRLSHCTIYGAWSGSATTLGDLDPRYLLGLEVDKFTKNASEEADPLALLLERGAEIPDRRFFGESTPTIAGKSRIDKKIRAGTDSRWHVPCPHCRHHQPLVLGTKDATKEGGLTWDKDPNGKSIPELAYRTARYICRKCRKEIHDDQRVAMIRRGVMVSRGQKADARGRVRGAPFVQGPDFSFSLSRLYGSTFTFGRYARSFLEAAQDPDPAEMQSWLNNWAGEAWEPHVRTREWDEMAEALCIPERTVGRVPAGSYFLTVGVDVQQDHWVYQVVAWNHRQIGHVVLYGVCHSWSELAINVIRRAYVCEDGGPPMVPMMTLVDARDGNRTDEVRDFCRTLNRSSGPWVFPCMGSKAGTMQGKQFRKTPLDEKNNRKASTRKKGLLEFLEITVNTDYYQVWIQNCLDRRDPSLDNSLSFPEEARLDQDLWDQLMNEVPSWQAGTTGHETCVFVRTSLLVPNDLRDALRYARVAADVYTNLKWDRVPRGRTLSLNKKEVQRPQPTPTPTETKEDAAAPEPDPWIRRKSLFLRG